MALAADRAGVAQRPSETIYEYAGWLEEQIPAQRPEIRAIADGKVWQSYSGKGVTSDVIARMGADQCAPESVVRRSWTVCSPLTTSW